MDKRCCTVFDRRYGTVIHIEENCRGAVSLVFTTTSARIENQINTEMSHFQPQHARKLSATPDYVASLKVALLLCCYQNKIGQNF
jgi:hypothetical protein